jgi:hypothetical protein
MPFTFSHPAIVLPFFKNKKWSITGLIIGSMAPDFEFFFRMRTQSEISHTFHGLLLIDFPLAIIVVILFHGILKKSLISNSPDFVQNRLVELKNSNWFDYFKKNSFIVILSFFVGAFSHFFWDSLTHWDGYVVQRVSFLNILLFSFPIYDWIQYISSIVGLVALGLYFFKIPQNSDSTSNVSLVFWIITLFFASIVVFLRFTLVVGWHRVADIIIGVLSSIVIALTFTSVIFMKYKRS